MIKLPPGVRFEIDGLNRIKGTRNLKFTAVQHTGYVTFTVFFDVPDALVNPAELQVSDTHMDDKSHFSFIKDSTEIIQEQDDTQIVLEPINPGDRGNVELYSFFTVTDGKVGGAGPKLKFQNLVNQKDKKK